MMKRCLKPRMFLSLRGLGEGGGDEDVDEEGGGSPYAFGAGRRFCPGQRMAETSLVSQVLFLFYVLPSFPSLLPRLDLDG